MARTRKNIKLDVELYEQFLYVRGIVKEESIDTSID